MAQRLELVPHVTGFQWDDGNAVKSWRRHQVTQTEAEQVFLNRPLVVTSDEKHSGQEQRHWALGRTDSGRHLLVVFTVRQPLLRVISARPMNRRERRIYAQAEAP